LASQISLCLHWPFIPRFRDLDMSLKGTHGFGCCFGRLLRGLRVQVVRTQAMVSVSCMRPIVKPMGVNSSGCWVADGTARGGCAGAIGRRRSSGQVCMHKNGRQWEGLT
jgi:hypothetical protein